MINHQGHYVRNLSLVIKPLNDLLQEDASWVWDQSQIQAFKMVKELLSSSRARAFFDTNKETTVSANASSDGIGAALLQKQSNGELTSVSFTSCMLSPAETRYAQIKEECLV